MLRLFICIGFLLAGLSLKAQKDFGKENIKILRNSELVIIGRTNVNKFQCKFNIELISDRQEIKYGFYRNLINFYDLELHLLTGGFDCGNKMMNNDFQALLLSETHPEIEIKLDQVALISEEFAKAFITVKLAGKKNYYDLPVKISNNRFRGNFKLNIRHFGLEPPKKALGLIEVDEEIEVHFDLKIKSTLLENEEQ